MRVYEKGEKRYLVNAEEKRRKRRGKEGQAKVIMQFPLNPGFANAAKNSTAVRYCYVLSALLNHLEICGAALVSTAAVTKRMSKRPRPRRYAVCR